jgi:type III secretory pathway component EscU
MFKNKTYNTRVILTYTIMIVALILFSCLGLIWKDWEILACVVCGSAFGLADAVLLVKGSETLNPQEEKKTLFYISGVLRYLVIILGVGVPALIVYLTMPNPADKMRYLNILGATVPFLALTITVTLIKPDEEKPVVGGTEK